MKKLLVILCIAVFGMSTNVYARTYGFEVIPSNVNFNAVDCELSINGELNSEKDRTPVLMEILPTGETTYDKIAMASVTYTENGQFKFDKIKLSSKFASGTYDIRLSSMHNETVHIITGAFYYGGSSAAIEAIKALDGATDVTEMNTALTQSYKDLGFIYYDYYTKTTSKNLIFNELIKVDFPGVTGSNPTEENVKAEWKKLIKLLEENTLAAYLSDCNDEDKFEALLLNTKLDEYYNLGIKSTDENKIYPILTSVAKEELDKLLLDISLTETSQLAKEFKDKCAVSYIRCGRYTDLQKIFSLVSDIRAVDYTNFNKLSATTLKQDEILKNTVTKAKTLNNISAVISYFETECSVAAGGNPPANPPANPPGGSSAPSNTDTNFIPVTENDPPLREGAFDDIADYPWAKSAIEAMYKKGVIDGVGDGKFEPGTFVTRAQLAKIVVLAFNLELSQENPVRFNDFGNEWFSEYVNILSSNKIVNGYEDGSFRPNGDVTRQELSVILKRACEFKNMNKPYVREYKNFSDDTEIAPYAREAIIELYRYGVLNGDNGNVMPAQCATRAQCVQLVYLLLGE